MAQRGAALLTALLIVAVAVTLTAGMMAAQHLEIRSSGNLLDRDRALQYALGGEGWAMGILTRDASEGPTDHLNEPWATALPAIAVGGGTIAGGIRDLQGLFNLNNLLLDGKQSPEDFARFTRLLRVVGLESRLAAAVVDWIDADDRVSGPGGAEEGSYYGKQPGYRPANQFFVTATELRQVEGFTGEAVALLLPLVTALPERTELNINTAPVELLMTLVENMPKADAMALDGKRQQDKGYTNVNDLLNDPLLKGKTVLSGGLGVASHYFLLEQEVRLGRGRTRLASLLLRKEGGVRVLRRAQGGVL
ncbi:MAG: type II secretion system minor pseudopilin GspK [Magnetococcales bacterium]|nr:type II secretion system minor pseudopilin GspK [Magnetococcales bacterium]